MTFVEKYHTVDQWFEKILIMEIFHLVMSSKTEGWTLKNTATEFNVSVALTSENLKLARLFHIHPKLMNCDTREIALSKARRYD